MKEVRKKTGAHGDPVELAVALSAAQEQQAQLEQTLSSETKVKMDLFSALGGARRQLQINESEYRTTVYRLGVFASFWWIRIHEIYLPIRIWPATYFICTF